MSDALLVRGARQLVTLKGPGGPRRGLAKRNLGIVPDGAVLIVDGVIRAVGQGRRVENLELARRAIEIDAARRVVLPGFVDCHAWPLWTHLALSDADSELKSAPDRAPLNPLQKAFRPISTTSTNTLERRLRLALEDRIRQGITTLDARAGLALNLRGLMKCLRTFAKLKELLASLVPTCCIATPEEETGATAGHWPPDSALIRIARGKLARFVDVRCGRGALPLEHARRRLREAHQLGFGLKVQADQLSHTGGTRLAVELGATSADGLEFASLEDVTALAQSTTIATLMPAVSASQRHGRFAPARSLIDHGAAVALATGYNPVWNPSGSMTHTLSLACHHLRMSAAEAIAAATINAAYALDCGSRTGSLEAGKDGDLVLLDASDYREIPSCFAKTIVVMTIKRGRILYRRGEVLWPKD